MIYSMLHLKKISKIQKCSCDEQSTINFDFAFNLVVIQRMIYKISPKRMLHSFNSLKPDQTSHLLGYAKLDMCQRHRIEGCLTKRLTAFE